MNDEMLAYLGLAAAPFLIVGMVICVAMIIAQINAERRK